MKVAIAAVFYTILFISIEIITRKSKISNEFSRKIAHILAGTSAALLPLVMGFREIMVLSLLFLPVMLISKRKNLFSSIHEVSRKTHGELYFPVAIFITAWLFPHREIFMYGVMAMALGDGLASIFGQKYGHKKYTLWQGQKSYVGSFAFFATTCIIGFVIASQVPIWLIVGSAFILTFVEAALSGGLDNLVLPPLAGSLLFGILKLLVSG